MDLDYLAHANQIKERLDTAHNPTIARVRGIFFQGEYRYFQQHIRGETVLVAGSGLGDDSFELAKYNPHVVGVDVIALFVEESLRRAENYGIDNTHFYVADFTSLDCAPSSFDSAVLNMGTIGNIEDKLPVLRELLRVAPAVHADFYPPTLDGLEQRKKMYEEEGWQGVYIDDTTIKSGDGLVSRSLAEDVVRAQAAMLNVEVDFFPICDFAVMARMYRK